MEGLFLGPHAAGVRAGPLTSWKARTYGVWEVVYISYIRMNQYRNGNGISRLGLWGWGR